MTVPDKICIITIYILIMAGCLFCLGTAKAETLSWEYVDRDGVVTYTDQLPPAAYRAAAELIIVGPLDEYQYFTRDDHPFVPHQTVEDRPEATIVEESAPAPTPPRERRRKRHRSERN